MTLRITLHCVKLHSITSHYFTLQSIPFLSHSFSIPLHHTHMCTHNIYIYKYTTSMHIWWYCIIYMSNKEYIRSNKHHSALQHSLWWLWDCSTTSAYHIISSPHGTAPARVSRVSIGLAVITCDRKQPVLSGLMTMMMMMIILLFLLLRMDRST